MISTRKKPLIKNNFCLKNNNKTFLKKLCKNNYKRKNKKILWRDFNINLNSKYFYFLHPQNLVGNMQKDITLLNLEKEADIKRKMLEKQFKEQSLRLENFKKLKE